MLELAILGLLKELPLHGYELKKRLNDTLGHVWGVSYGSLYPALARLERTGAIEVVDPPAAAPAGIPIPATGSIAGEAAAARLRRPLRRRGRTRKAYRLAAAGQALFNELLRADTDPGHRREPGLRPQARLLPPPRPRRPAWSSSSAGRQPAGGPQLARGRQAKASDRYTRALIEHETTTAERDLDWVDSLIAAERGATRCRETA